MDRWPRNFMEARSGQTHTFSDDFDDIWVLSSSALFLGSHQQNYVIYLLQPWCLLPGLLFNYFPIMRIWKYCSFFPLYYSACDLFSCYPAGSCFFMDGDLLKWESFLQLHALSLRNHSRFTCKRILKLIWAIQGNQCFLLGEVGFLPSCLCCIRESPPYSKGYA